MRSSGAGEHGIKAAELVTQRLRLRPWREDDLDGFAALNADPRVMEHYPAILARAESDALARRIIAHFEAHGFGLFAVEIPGRSAFAGYVGLRRVSAALPFAPAVEIAWRLAHVHWGQGYASEAAREALRFGFSELQLERILAYTTPVNLRSRAVMAAIGLTRVIGGDFDHPALPDGHPLKKHLLYEACAPARGV